LLAADERILSMRRLIVVPISADKKTGASLRLLLFIDFVLSLCRAVLVIHHKFCRF
jgi:hypothetical protein